MKEYTDQDLEKEFPLRKKICKYDKCKKEFLTRFDERYHSHRCFLNDIRQARKDAGTWIKYNKRVKSARNNLDPNLRCNKGPGDRKRTRSN